MSIYIRYFIATLFFLFVSMFFWPSFINVSLFELSTGATIIQGSRTNSGMQVFQLAIGVIPVLVLVTSLLNKRTNYKTLVVTSITIFSTGIFLWQARITILNFKFKRLNYILSLNDNNIVNTAQLDNLLLEHYFASAPIIGAILINICYYFNKKRMVTSNSNP